MFIKYAVIYLLVANIVGILSIKCKCGYNWLFGKLNIHWCNDDAIYGFMHTESWNLWCVYIGRFSFGYGLPPRISADESQPE